jgi:hypothetical protein
MKLNQVTVPSTDVVKSIEFYKRLGLIQIVDSPPKYARFVCPDGDAPFQFITPTNSQEDQGRLYISNAITSMKQSRSSSNEASLSTQIL